MKNSGVDVFIVHDSLSKKRSNYINLNHTKSIELEKNLMQLDEQGLLPITFICEIRYNNTRDLNERRCLPIQTDADTHA